MHVCVAILIKYLSYKNLDYLGSENSTNRQIYIHMQICTNIQRQIYIYKLHMHGLGYLIPRSCLAWYYTFPGYNSYLMIDPWGTDHKPWFSCQHLPLQLQSFLMYQVISCFPNMFTYRISKSIPLQTHKRKVHLWVNFLENLT